MTLDELPAVLAIFRDRAATAAGPTAKSMADTYKVHLTRVTLQRYHAEPGDPATPWRGEAGTPAPPYVGPPAFRTGRLAGSVTSEAGASAPGYGSASVAPHTIYAVTQEEGEVHTPTRFKYMHWVDTAGPHYRKRVYIPPRPYMATATRETVADGSLTRSAALMFRSLVGPY